MQRVVLGLSIVAALVVTLVGAAKSAHARGYATDEGGRIYRVLPDEKKTELLGKVVITETRGAKTKSFTPSLTDLALSDLHGLYAISFTTLYKIDMRDPAKSKRIGELSRTVFAQFNALAFDDQGRLFALEGGSLCQVSLKTGLATVLGDMGDSWGSDGDLAWVGDALYASVNRGARCHLVRLDPKTWKAKDIGIFRRAPKKVAGAKVAGRKGVAPKKKAAPGTVAPTPEAKKGATAATSITTFDDVWGLIWDGTTLYALTPKGEVLEVDWKTAVVRSSYRTRVTYYGACPMLRM